jgi:hypothetical protein
MPRRSVLSPSSPLSMTTRNRSKQDNVRPIHNTCFIAFYDKYLMIYYVYFITICILDCVVVYFDLEIPIPEPKRRRRNSQKRQHYEWRGDLPKIIDELKGSGKKMSPDTARYLVILIASLLSENSRWTLTDAVNRASRLMHVRPNFAFKWWNDYVNTRNPNIFSVESNRYRFFLFSGFFFHFFDYLYHFLPVTIELVNEFQ